jgi:hypothetical protein
MASAFFSFVIALFGLAIVVAMIFLALDRIAKDAFLVKMGKLAVGGCAVLMLLLDAKATFFGGGGGNIITPVALIEFAIGVIILIGIFFLIDWAVTLWLSPWATPINYVLSILMLVLILFLAEQALVGGGLGFISGSTFPATRAR